MEKNHVQVMPHTADHQPSAKDDQCLIDFLIKRTAQYPHKTAFCDVDIDLQENPFTYSELLFQVKGYAQILKNKNTIKRINTQMSNIPS